MGFGTWLKLLLRNRLRISPRNLGLALKLTVAGLGYSVLGCLQNMAFAKAESSVAITRPVFILGHWRSGTTLLHELLCLCTGYNFPTTYACMNPHHFLFSERLSTESEQSVSIERPMDRMTVSLDSPQEEEFALLALGFRSIYECLLFPNGLSGHLETACNYREMNNRNRAKSERCFLSFLKKLSIRRNDTILLKSPPNAFRVEMLNKLFPDARYVQIVRNPYVVFASSVFFWQKMISIYSLHACPAREEIEQFVMDCWLRMEECLKDAPFNQKNHYILKYEDLVDDKQEALRKLLAFLDVQQLEAGGSDRLHTYLDKAESYKTNTYRLDQKQRELVEWKWASIFQRYGYSREQCPLQLIDPVQ